MLLYGLVLLFLLQACVHYRCSDCERYHGNLSSLTTVSDVMEVSNLVTSFHGMVTNVSFVDSVTPEVRYRGYKVAYSVTYSEEYCCPILNINNWDSRYHELRCFPEHYLSQESTINENLIQLSPHHSECSPVDDGSGNDTDLDLGLDLHEKGKLVYTCKGVKMLLLSEEKRWRVTFGYSCKQATNGHKLNLKYSVTFTEISESKTLAPIHHVCSDTLDYKSYVLPNIMGQMKPTDIRDTINLFRLGADTFKCYKHIHQIACRVLYPASRSGKVYYPCKQMCDELVAGCKNQLDAFGVYLTCSWLVDSLDPEICFYKAVTCDPPQVPQNGSIPELDDGARPNKLTFTPGERLRVTCNDGYRLRPPIGYVSCTWFGVWAPQYSCQYLNIPPSPGQPPNTPSNSSNIIIGVVFGIAVTVASLVAVGVYLIRLRKKRINESNRQRLDLADFAMPTALLKKQTSYRYDIFISYCTADTPFLYRGEDCLRRKLEGKGYLLCLHGRDFLPGNHIASNIVGAMEQSRCVVCLLSRAFLASEWCLFEFDLFQNQVLLNSDFRLILILLEGEDSLAEAPAANSPGRTVWGYVKRFVYLSALDEHFEEKLFHALPHPTCAQEQGIEPGGVHPVLTDHIA